MNFRLTLFLLIASFCYKGNSQNYQAALKDFDTKEIIPYASVLYARNNGVITNEEGKFNLDLSKIKQDSIFISSVGYLKKGFAVNNLKDSIIYLKGAIENLDLVYLTKKNHSAEEIMEFVASKIDSNYNATLTNQKVFYRQSYITKVNLFDMKIKESSIPEIDKILLDSIKLLIPKRTDRYNEMLGNYYTDTKSKKLIITKAAELYDKNVNLSMEGISTKLEKIFTENVKSNSYLKIKSGIFGTKVQVDSILAENKESKELQEKLKSKDSLANNDSSKMKLLHVKRSINNLYSSLFYKEDPTFNLIDKINRYKYTLNGFTLVNDEPCYIIHFEPKGSKEFKGTLHINVNDYAIVQMDYQNVKSLKDFSLLGISYSEDLYASKVFFRKKDNNYIPYFIQLEKGMSFGIKRPLSIIEKNKHVKGRNKQNEVALKIEIKMEELERFEYLVYETSKINQKVFDELVENKKFKANYLQKYDADFWADEHIVAPNNVIQRFSINE